MISQEIIFLVLMVFGFIFLIALGFKYDEIMRPINAFFSKCSSKELRKKNDNANENIESYKLDLMLKIIFIGSLFLTTKDFFYRNQFYLVEVVPEIISLLIFWCLFIFGIHKIEIVNNNSIRFYRLFWKREVSVSDLQIMFEQPGYYKVVHKSGCFRFVDFISGSRGLVSRLTNLNNSIRMERFSLQNFHKSPLGIKVILDLFIVAVAFVGGIGLSLWFYLGK